ncbi:unnamed protein product [Scytosiphon promiscuus]
MKGARDTRDSPAGQEKGTRAKAGGGEVSTGDMPTSAAISAIRITQPVRAEHPAEANAAHTTQQTFFDTPVGQALRDVNTSNQWSTLTGVLTKLNRKLPARQQVDARTLARLLASTPAAELARNGVWTTSFGAKYMPIVIVNRSYARKVAGGEEQGCCSCGKGDQGGARSSRFFGSQDYNAGRHALEASGHSLSCLCWTPPSTGHLHSWRRGFD